MSHLNFSSSEMVALRTIEAMELDGAISRCVDSRNGHELAVFRLDLCGEYVARKAREFDSALRAYSAAKAAKKTKTTGSAAIRAGYSLSSALRRTQEALEQEVQDSEQFRVYDDMIPPGRLSADISIRVSFQWRASASDPWTVGSIVFTHTAVRQNDYLVSYQRRKPSASAQERKRQDDLYLEWEHLKRLALGSLRDFFRSGGLAANVPKVFPVVLDRFDNRLNNYSADFWRGVTDSPNAINHISQ